MNAPVPGVEVEFLDDEGRPASAAAAELSAFILAAERSWT